MEEKFHTVLTFIWTKDTVKPAGDGFVNNMEAILVGCWETETPQSQTSGWPYNSKCFSIRPTAKWKYTDGSNGGGVVNPAQKPIRLWVHLLSTLVPQPVPGSLAPCIIDLTSGSGSLSHACAQAGYNSIAYDTCVQQLGWSYSHLTRFLSATRGIVIAEEGSEEEDSRDNNPAEELQDGIGYPYYHEETY